MGDTAKVEVTTVHKKKKGKKLLECCSLYHELSPLLTVRSSVWNTNCISFPSQTRN